MDEITDILDNHLMNDIYNDLDDMIDDVDDDNDEYVDDNKNLDDKQLRLQKIHRYDRFLPYHKQIEDIRCKYWLNLSKNLSESVFCCEDNQMKNLSKWIDSFTSYISLYDLALTKDEHIFLIKLFINSLNHFQNDYQLINRLVSVLNRLLKDKKLISRSELMIDWRIIFELYENIQQKVKDGIDCQRVLDGKIKKLIINTRTYYSNDATKEMINEWKQYICPVNYKKYIKYLKYFSLFLPTLLHPRDHEFGHKLWFNDFIDIFNWNIHESLLPLLKLFSRLAEDVYGFIDWQPYISIIYNTFPRICSRSVMICISNRMKCIFYYLKLFSWIITPMNFENDLHHLKRMILIVKNGRGSNGSLKSVLIIFKLLIVRYKKERKNDWFNYIPYDYKLNEQTIAKVGHLLMDNIDETTLIFRKQLPSFELKNFHVFVNLNTRRIADMITKNLELIHNEYYDQCSYLKSALKIYSLSLHPIILDGEIGPKYRLQLIPMLFQMMETLNIYDENLCMIQLSTIKSILNLEFPIMNCSTIGDQTSDITMNNFEKQMCLQSSRFDQFVDDLIKFCQLIIESNNEKLFSSISTSNCLSIIMLSILQRMNETMCKSFIDAFVSMILSNIYENGFTIIHIVIESIAMTYPDYLLQKLFPSLNKHLKMLMSDHHDDNHNQMLSPNMKLDYLYHHQILMGLFKYCNGASISIYQEEIITLLTQLDKFNLLLSTTSSASKQLWSGRLCSAYRKQMNGTNSNTFYNLLKQLYENLLDEKIKLKVNQLKPEMMKFEYWPKLLSMKQFSVEWHQITANELNFAHRLIETFLKNKLLSLEDWLESKIEMKKDELLNHLRIISVFNDSNFSSPKFISFTTDNDECSSTYYSTLLSEMNESFSNDLIECRQRILAVISNILIKLNNERSDDTESYGKIIDIYESYFIKNFKRPFGASFVKKMFEKKLSYQFQMNTCQNEYTWIMHLDSLIYRNLFLKSNLAATIADEQLNESQIKILKNLLLLCQSDYLIVRNSARFVLESIFFNYKTSSSFIMDDIIVSIEKCQNFDSLATILGLINANCKEAIIINSSIDSLLKLYPVLMRINFFAHNFDEIKMTKIFKVFASNFRDYGHYNIIDCSSQSFLVDYFNDEQLKFPHIFVNANSKNLVEEWQKKKSKSNENERKIHNQLVDTIISIMQNENIHWRLYLFGFSLLNYLITPLLNYPSNGIMFLIENLTNDLLSIREASLKCLVKILQIIHRFNKNFIEINPDSSIHHEINVNNYLNNSNLHNVNEKLMFDQKQLFLDCSVGYYKNLSYRIKICKNNELNNDYDIFDAISQKLDDNQFRDKLFELNCIENGKEMNRNNIRFWKLFFIYSPIKNLDMINNELIKLFDHHHHDYDKYALEILSGLAKAIKLRNDYDYYEKFKIIFRRIIDDYFLKFNSESQYYWRELLSCLFYGKDSRCNYWCSIYLFNRVVFNNQTNSNIIELSPFYKQEIIPLLIDYAFDSNWRYPLMTKYLIDSIFDNISSTFGYIRSSYGRLLGKCIVLPIGLKSEQINFNFEMIDHNNKLIIDTLFKNFDDKINILINRNPNNSDDMDLISIQNDLFDKNKENGENLLLQSIDILCSFCQSLSEQMHLIADSLRLLPFLFVIQTNEQSIMNKVDNHIYFIAESIRCQNQIVADEIIGMLQMLSNNWNWRTREKILKFINIQLNHTLLSCDYYDKIQLIIIKQLFDDQIEVRIVASKTFCQLLRIQPLTDDQRIELIESFRLKLTSNQQKCGNISQIHGAILGLCSFINAYASDDFPDFIPDILIMLIANLNNVQVVKNTINETLRTFKKNHIEYWNIYKHKFTSEQLYQLNNVLISSSHYN